MCCIDANKNYEDTIKKVCYILCMIINTCVSAVISQNVLKLDSPQGQIMLWVSSGLTSVALMVATRTKDIQAILEKLNMTQDNLNLKIEDLNKLNTELQSVKSQISSRSIAPSEPISEEMQPIEIITSARNNKFKAYYDYRTNTINISQS